MKVPESAGQRLGCPVLQELLREPLKQDVQPTLIFFRKGFQFRDCGFTLGVGGRRLRASDAVVTG